MTTHLLSEQRENGIITDGQGYGLQGMREIVEHIRQTELGQELTLPELYRLGYFAWNTWNRDLAELTEERLAEIQIAENDSFVGEYNTPAEFAEELSFEYGLVDSQFADNVVIDWAATYDSQFQYDYSHETLRGYDNGELFFFSFFWSNNA
jgi:hypothetical protein